MQYDDAYANSGAENLYNDRIVSAAALAVAATVTSVATTFFVLRLIKYLGIAH
jgi:hypothetical protein